MEIRRPTFYYKTKRPVFEEEEEYKIINQQKLSVKQFSAEEDSKNSSPEMLAKMLDMANKDDEQHLMDKV